MRITGLMIGSTVGGDRVSRSAGPVIGDEHSNSDHEPGSRVQVVIDANTGESARISKRASSVDRDCVKSDGVRLHCLFGFDLNGDGAMDVRHVYRRAEDEMPDRFTANVPRGRSADGPRPMLEP